MAILKAHEPNIVFVNANDVAVAFGVVETYPNIYTAFYDRL